MSIYNDKKVSKINTVSAPCGGMNYATTKQIKKTTRNSNWLYVDMITSHTRPHYVAGSIIRYLNAADPSGQVLLIAWVSYQNIPFFPNWHRCIRIGAFP